jgi:hypothetical protein
MLSRSYIIAYRIPVKWTAKKSSKTRLKSVKYFDHKPQYIH